MLERQFSQLAGGLARQLLPLMPGLNIDWEKGCVKWKGGLPAIEPLQRQADARLQGIDPRTQADDAREPAGGFSMAQRETAHYIGSHETAPSSSATAFP